MGKKIIMIESEVNYQVSTAPLLSQGGVAVGRGGWRAQTNKN